MPPQDPPPSPAPRRSPLRSRRGRIVAGSLLAVAAFVAVFDWTWFRPLIQHHIQERSGRRIDFDTLHIGLDRSLDPTVRLTRLVVQNAPWAARAQPLVQAGEFAFTLSWRSLSGGPVLLKRLEMVDADLDLERQADGLRNWRLTRPDDRGPGRVRVQAIEARNTRMHVADAGQRLELDLQVQPLPAPITLPAHAGLPLVRAITLRGTRDATPFEAQLAVSAWPSFFDTGRAFALRGELQSGASRAQFDGTVADLMQLAQVDMGLQLTGTQTADLARVAGFSGAARRLPALPSQASAHVARSDGRWTISALQARIGRSDLAGRAEIARDGSGRSSVRAALTSERIDIAGWRAARPAASAAEAPVAGAPSRLDAAVEWRVAAIEGAGPLPLTSFATRIVQREGRIAFEALQFSVAGGRAAGTLAVDSERSPRQYALDLQLQGLQIARLARATASGQATEGERAGGLSGGLNGHLVLRSQGDSLADLSAAMQGTAMVELVRASIPQALDAKLALDGGHLLRSMFGAGRDRAAVTCAVLEMRFDRGRGEARRLAFETGSVAVAGSGWVDVGKRSVDLLLTPRRKQAALFALDRSMRVSGALGSPKFALAERGAPGVAAAPCAAPRVQ